MSKKVLIVDDEIHIRALLEQSIEELEEDHDVEIMSAVDGEQGLTMIRQEIPDVVFLDIMMPKMNGYDVCRAVKDDSALSCVNVILLTAKGQEADRELGMELGALTYMTKPFDPDEVLDLAKDLLGLKNS